MLRLAFLFCGFGISLHAASLPGALSQTEVNRVTRFLAMGGATRLLRSSEAYPPWPGLKFGVEISVLPGGNISSLGNGVNSVAGILPSPRIYLAKGIAQGLEIVGSFFPAGLNTLSGVGGILKWNFLPENEEWVSMAAFFGVTGLNAFQGEFKGTNFELGISVSKDYVRMRPYLGAALMLAKGEIAPTLATANTTAALAGSHFFLGAEFELPFNFTLQADLINLDPMITAFIGKRF
jgi:hypothetical protein